MGTYGEQLDAAIRAAGGNPDSKLYGDQLQNLTTAIAGINLVSPITLTPDQKAQVLANLGVTASNLAVSVSDEVLIIAAQTE